METDKKIRRGLYLQEQIRDLEYFLNTVKPVKASFDIRQKAILNIKEERSFSIFGSRFFGCGTHKKEIHIPQSMVDRLFYLTLEKLEEYKEEYKGL